MNDPIISPWFVYFLGTVQGVTGVGFIFSLISAVGLAIAVMSWFINKASEPPQESAYSEEWRKKMSLSRAGIKLSLWVLIPSIIIVLFLPSQRTMIGMIVAKNVTPNTINKAIEAGVSVKDAVKQDVLDIIQALKEEKKEEKKEKKSE